MLLSSVAEAMFWTGRYVERAQALARVVLAYERLNLDLRASRPLELGPLFVLAGRAPEPVRQQARGLSLRQLVFDAENQSSVLGALLAARENLRQARVVAPAELWTTLGALVQSIKSREQAGDGAVLEALENALALGSRFEGERQTGMAHDSAHAFLDAGTNLERADMLLRALSVLLPALSHQGWERAFDDVRWAGLLQALGLHSAYRRLHHHQAEPPLLLALALSDGSCPRSVAYCLRAMERPLRLLPRAGQVRDQLSYAIHATLDTGKPSGESTAAELERMLEALSRVGAALQSCYFPRQAEALSAAREVVVDPAAACDPFAHLGREHAQMDAALGVLETLVLRSEAGEKIDCRDLQVIVSFFSDCGELGHHEKEESILTPALVAHGFDWYAGPLASMRRDHRQEHYFIRVLSQLASQRDEWSKEDRQGFARVVREFCHFLHAHMDHERYELFEQGARTLPPLLKEQLCKAFEALDAQQGRSAAGSRVALSALMEKYPLPAALRSAS